MILIMMAMMMMMMMARSKTRQLANYHDYKALVNTMLKLIAWLVVLAFASVAATPTRKCPVFECLPYLMATDLTQIGDLFSYESIIGITTKDDQ